MDIKSSFLATNVFDIKGRGIVITGKVQEGTIGIGMKTIVNGKEATVSAIEAFRKTLSEAKTGEEVGLLMKGDLKKEDFDANIKLARPVEFV